MIAGANISPCRKYRYELTRLWCGSAAAARVLTWIMLNPSTATALTDDPTIRKCIGFSKRWGFDGLRVVNLFAYRSTHPEVLRHVADPFGDNSEWLRSVRAPAVAAWGAIDDRLERDWSAVPAHCLLDAIFGGELVCLGQTKQGHPRHPLMLPYRTERQPWP